MQDRIIKILIVDDANDIDAFYSWINNCKEEFEVQFTADGKTACQLISSFCPEIVLADIDKFTEHQEVVEAVKRSKSVLVWASKFRTINFEDLPVVARIMNKPFRDLDVRFTIRSELHRANRAAYIKV